MLYAGRVGRGQGYACARCTKGFVLGTEEMLGDRFGKRLEVS
jgi:hypothetical protein